ncbi:MAG TPA: hypothetical protein VFW23_09120 [Tepidisphaeraceae bacterium]|nr:hypothetical protein [Tepidisphaeraceae bacterium]
MTDSARKPLIRRALLLTSLGLALAAEILFIVIQIRRRPFEPVLFILTIGWPFYYAITTGFAFGMAWTARSGGVTGWPERLQRQYPSMPIQRSLQMWFTLAVGFTLIAFPLMASAIAVLVLCSKSASGR